MKSKTQPHHKHSENHEVNQKISNLKHILMGYLFLFLVFMGAISSVYYWQNKNRIAQGHVYNAERQVESGEQSPTNSNSCEQGVVTARQRETGEIRDFPSPCHVGLDNWEIIK